MRKLTTIALWAALCCFFAGAALAAKPAYRLIKRSVMTWRAKQTWEEWKRLGCESDAGDPIAWLTAEDAGLDTLILCGASKENLHLFPCWSASGCGPGEQGLKIVTAHRDIHFQQLGKLNVGNVFTIEAMIPEDKTTEQTTASLTDPKDKDTVFTERQYRASVTRYTVIKTEILTPDAAARRLAEKAGKDMLVLMTCHPFVYIGPAPERYLVWAEAIHGKTL